MPIKLTKAIEILEGVESKLKTAPDPDFYSSYMLGLAGLKAIQYCRHGGRWHPKALLPGEQPEEIEKGG